MQLTALELSNLLEGKLEGNPEVKITRPAKIEEGQEGTVSFLANPKYNNFAYSTQASVLIVNDDLVLEQEVQPTLIRVKDAYSSFTKVLEMYSASFNQRTGREEPVKVAESAKIGADVYLGAFSYIGEGAEIGEGAKIFPNVYIGDGAKIGAHSIVYPGVWVYHHCEIGQHCIIHSGTVIGSDGFGFAPQADGQFKKVPQLGNVVIEDQVEIGANTTIDRATIGSTIIRKGVKLDNLIQVAHNVEIGEHTVIAAQTGVSGSTKLGRQCMIGGQVGFVGHLSIADGTRINAQSGVSKSVKKPGTALNGSPAWDYTESLRSQVMVRRLPELEERLKALEAKLNTHQKENNER